MRLANQSRTSALQRPCPPRLTTTGDFVQRGMSRAPDIYGLDPAARQLLQLDTFRNKFVVNEFVQGLSAANIASTALRSGNDALDPKPYIRTFESALTKLQDLRADILREGKDIDAEVKAAEVQFSRRNSQLEDTFREINSTFTGLQNRISEVGKVAITIGNYTR